MKFYLEIQGTVTSAVVEAVIGRKDITVTAMENKTFISGDVSCYALGWILDRCSWFGRVGVIIPENKLPQWSPSKDKGA